jgi:hypothetical protein
LQKSTDLHRLLGLVLLVDKPIEGLTSCVIDNQHRSPALAHEFHRPQRPRTIEVVPELVFMRKPIDALERRMLGAGKARYESVSGAFGGVARESAERAVGVFPQHLKGIVSATSAQPD